MNAGLDADQPTRAMTPEQIKEDAAYLRKWASHGNTIAADCTGVVREMHEEQANRCTRAADLLDSLTVESVTHHDGQHRAHTKRRLVGPWSEPEITDADLRGCASPSRPSEQPTTKEEER